MAFVISGSDRLELKAFLEVYSALQWNKPSEERCFKTVIESCQLPAKVVFVLAALCIRINTVLYLFDDHH